MLWGEVVLSQKLADVYDKCKYFRRHTSIVYIGEEGYSSGYP